MYKEFEAGYAHLQKPLLMWNLPFYGYVFFIWTYLFISDCVVTKHIIKFVNMI